AGRARDEHRPLPVGREPLPDDARDPRRAGGVPDPGLGPDQVAAGAARRRPVRAHDPQRPEGLGQPLGADARRGRLAAHPAPHPPPARRAAGPGRGRRGIEPGALTAPLMPGINDSPEQVEPILERARKADATFLGGVALHLRDEVKDVFFAWLQSRRPDLLPRYEALYQDRAYMKPPQRKHATRALRTWGANSRRRSNKTVLPVGDSGGDSENVNLARRSLPPRQAPPAQRPLF